MRTKKRRVSRRKRFKKRRRIRVARHWYLPSRTFSLSTRYHGRMYFSPLRNVREMRRGTLPLPNGSGCRATCLAGDSLSSLGTVYSASANISYSSIFSRYLQVGNYRSKLPEKETVLHAECSFVQKIRVSLRTSRRTTIVKGAVFPQFDYCNVQCHLGRNPHIHKRNPQNLLSSH